MALCDHRLEAYIRTQHYDQLSALPPLKRFVRKLQLKLDALTLKIEPDDQIFGWFVFGEDAPEHIPPLPEDPLSPEEEKILKGASLFGSRCGADNGHTLVDYGEILEHGLVEYDRRIRERRAKEPDNEYLRAMQETLAVIKAYCENVADYIGGQLAQCAEADRPRLTRMRDMMRRVPWHPARDFREAVQSVWIIHFLLPMAGDAWYSISLGRFDRFMEPYYQKSLQAGMTLDEATAIMHNFYALLNNYADGACMLNVGGDAYSEFSEQIIRWHTDFAMPGPILGARISRDTPRHIWEMLIDEKLFSMGQPTFYGEEACVAALLEKGLPQEKARNFSNNSCMGIAIPGEEFNSMWGCVFSVSAALEAAVNGGRLLREDGFSSVPDIAPAASLEELYARFEDCAAYMLDVCIREYRLRVERMEKWDPQPFASLLLRDCIERGCDRISGVPYHNVTVECMGMVNAADGICAIDRLVFREKKYTLSEITEAVRSNFAHRPDIRAAVMACPKFGQDSEADEYSVQVARILQKVIRAHSGGNMYFAPSLHTLDVNVHDGSVWGAGYDGRMSGEPFAKNGGPSNCARQKAPTAMVLSAAKLPQHQFFGGQPIDVTFPADAVKNRKTEIAALIQTYFRQGGLQVQVNSASSRVLRNAMAHPEQYPNLVVRIGGYSVYFHHLSRASQEEFVERFEKEGM